ncbi:hypothetical protein NX801_09440 [Streptomyces sp. LP05-1]|uniref:Lipoprotein n=1 Tax=Streptomyces pyxinae TaxID=2970734 RepID=A0ABT2CER2_9ACTN|nr:hypothetical protein [Streptomyces sp. LP05-1]MCS0635885.1 hypothetical protein [Streptomyces sp. LP05-1]
MTTLCGHLPKETVITAIRKTLTATAVVATVLAGSAACGTVQNLSAGQKLDRAFDQLGKEKSLSFELDLDTDAQTLQALDSDSAPDDKMPPQAADFLMGAKLAVSIESKKPLGESGEGDYTGMSMTLTSPEGTLIDYRLVDDIMYVKADVKALGKVAGAPLPSADELPPQAAGFKKLLQGEWVKLSLDEAKKAREGALGGPKGSGKPSPEPSMDAKTQQKLLDKVGAVVSREVDFTTASAKDGTEQISAVAPFRTLVTELVEAIRPMAKELPMSAPLPTAKDLKEAPTGKVTANFQLKNGALEEMSVDLTELAKSDKEIPAKAKAKIDKLGFTLRVGRGAAAKPIAPTGATELKPEEVLSGLFGGLGGADDADFEESGLEDPALGDTAFTDVSVDEPAVAQG